MNSMFFPTNDDWIDQDSELELGLEPDDELSLDLFLPAETTLEEQLAVEGLLDDGFSWEESLGLLRMRTKILENPEMQEHPRMQFARWMYQHGYLSEQVR